MKRTMMQMYIKDSCNAVKFYQNAFKASIVSEYKNDDGSYMHVELNAFGQILAISEQDDDRLPGNTMQFCFHFKDSEIDDVVDAYEVLKGGAQILSPIGQCFYSKCMFALIDKFGVNWCFFI